MRNLIGGLLAALLLCGCGEGGGQTAAAQRAAPDAAALCVNSACGSREVLLALPSAENLHFSDDGRLFVSSGTGFFEIFRNDDGSFRAEPAYEGASCGFTGIATRDDVLYVACGNGTLWAGRLDRVPAVVRPVFQISGMCIANGMTLGADGALYIVDEPLSFCVPDPKIVRLQINAADPLQIDDESVWVQGSPLGQLHLGLDTVMRFPNGLQAEGTRFYGTDGGSVFLIEQQADGSAGAVQPLFFEATAHDDLGLVPGGILVTDFFAGRILLLSREGALLQETDPGLFSFPSSVRLGRPPMFAADDILVTETGVLTEHRLPLDFLSVFRRRPSP